MNNDYITSRESYSKSGKEIKPIAKWNSYEGILNMVMNQRELAMRGDTVMILEKTLI